MNVPPETPSNFDRASQSEPWAYLNGQFVPASQARLPLFDAGLVQGATATDFVRTFQLRPYLLDQHLERFRTSCLLAEIPLQVGIDELRRIASELVSRNYRFLPPGQELALILIATPGALEFYAGDPQLLSGPTLALHTAPLNLHRFAAYWQTGVHLATPKVRALPGECIHPHIKHRSRLHWRLAQSQISREYPCATALLLDREGFITETAAANFLIVRRGAVISPPLTTVLEGISLRVVREICAELNIPFQEERIGLEDCERAQEAFLTNTSFCLASVSCINQFVLAWPGPVTQRILDSWSEKVGLDIAGQILEAR